MSNHTVKTKDTAAQTASAAQWDGTERRKDNWTLIVKEYAPKIGCKYKNHRGEYVFFGLVLAEDDYYYGLMRKDGKIVLATCVGALESMYEQVPTSEQRSPASDGSEEAR